MKIAVLSDIHDNIWNLEKAISQVKEKKCEALIFCGDMCAPFTAKLLSELKLPIQAVWGNADEDHWAIVKEGGEDFSAFPLMQEFGEEEIEGRKIAFCHYPKLGELLAGTNHYDAVFHGHSHRQYYKKVGKTLLANPGAVCGIIGGKPGLASFMIYNTDDNSTELVKIK
jgi:hypothetical protein